MPRREIEVTLRQMLDHAREAVSVTRGETLESLRSNRMLNLAVARLLEIIGEAATRVPPDERAKYPGIPWPRLVGLRNRLIHAYDEVDLEILWGIVARDLPGLVAELESAVGCEGPGA